MPDGHQPTSGKPIGIVDPFLTDPVLPGQCFYMFLYQNMVTSLRHEWEHPDFTAAETSEVAQSREWIEDWAGGYGVSYQDMIDAAAAWVDSEDYFCRGGTFECEGVPDVFWDHYEVVVGHKVSSHKKGSFFTCSC